MNEKYNLPVTLVNSGRRLNRERGFVLTLELILISTILVLGLIVGIVAIRDALVKYAANKQSREVIVVDDAGVRLGRVVGYDEHEAPRIPYIDRTVPPKAGQVQRNYRAMLAIRDDRITSREPIYYTGLNCTGDPCIKTTSNEQTDNNGVGRNPETGAVSYLHALQGGPNYAVGMSPDGIRGYLYRSTEQACPVGAQGIQSRYLSQRVIAGSPCEAFSERAAGSSAADTSCFTDIALREPANVDPVTGQAIDLNTCEECPNGYVDQGALVDADRTSIESDANQIIGDIRRDLNLPETKLMVGELCCPVGTSLSEEPELYSALVFVTIENALATYSIDVTSNPVLVDTLATYGVVEGNITCKVTFDLQAAEEVTKRDHPSTNALAEFVSPFRVNLPASVDDGWMYIPPNGEAR